MRTLLTGYLLSSQGDRMLMANSVEGRFPFLDHRLVELANSLPSSFKLRGLDEKLVLKRVAADLVPEARSWTGPSSPTARRMPRSSWEQSPQLGGRPAGWSATVRRGHLRPAGGAAPVAQVPVPADGRPFSNADNMALVGTLSTSLIHESW